jgi:2,5-dihydroxypyridine 5,6-dioxygenase
MDNKIIEMMKNAKTPYELHAKKGETVLILADTNTEPPVWQAFASVANQMGVEPIVVIIKPRPSHYYNPPDAVMEAMKKVDIIHYTTSTGMIHSPCGKMMSGLKKKQFMSEHMDANMLTKGGVEADINDVVMWGKKMAKAWTEGKKVRLVTDLGTDFTCDITGRPGCIDPTMGTNPENIEVHGMGFPCGESMIAPIEGTPEGTVVIDVAIQTGRVVAPVKWTIKKGKIVKIEGGVEAKLFEEWLKTYGDENANEVCEIAIGTNRWGRVTGTMREDRKIWGYCHIGFGMNLDIGGKVACNIHGDGILSKPNLYIDDKLVVENGNILL